MTRRLAHQGRTESYADAPPEAVFDIVSDVTRVGEWSHECRGAHWVGAEREAAPGVRFRGILQTYDLLHVAPGFDRIYWFLIKGHRDRRGALAADLDRLAALAAAFSRR
ncbi:MULTISPECIES: SRPBCC family protein [Gordonia]|uniref:SRPBCC family protein n=1 Tax=Gordonia amicalis TaxID=89053 RepID=A0AAE4U9G5_9ACTN|nr:MULTISPECIES: SRPBCC family protein [Gordonia]ATD71710.1 SRPBCC family protein [Gordonia sp. 1D]KAF0969078.1 hypothetical protein BPODLACK_02311 [Gordonia sp. YY1]MBA5847736.1 SRPBCC family protein [Gordonia amicalis]MCZ4581244.1 SRPBCC family protein [Gordonia amicalis]MDJ0453603.1 SRPBCC family protein [Gordonia amicalis]